MKGCEDKGSKESPTSNAETKVEESGATEKASTQEEIGGIPTDKTPMGKATSNAPKGAMEQQGVNVVGKGNDQKGSTESSRDLSKLSTARDKYAAIIQFNGMREKTNFGILRPITMPEHEKTCIVLSVTALKVYEHTKQNVTLVEAQWHELGISEFQKMIDNIDETAKEVMAYPPNRAINKMKMAPATCFTLFRNVKALTQYNDNEIVIEDCC